MPQSIVQPLRRWDPGRIGPYTIIGRLGAGAMGQVFPARAARAGPAHFDADPGEPPAIA